MKKLLMIALGLMALTGCTDEHYWDAEYIIEKYCSVASECHQSFSGCYDSRMEKYEKIYISSLICSINSCQAPLSFPETNRMKSKTHNNNRSGMVVITKPATANPLGELNIPIKEKIHPKNHRIGLSKGAQTSSNKERMARTNL